MTFKDHIEMKEIKAHLRAGDFLYLPPGYFLIPRLTRLMRPREYYTSENFGRSWKKISGCYNTIVDFWDWTHHKLETKWVPKDELWKYML